MYCLCRTSVDSCVGFIFFFYEEVADLFPHVLSFNSVVVNHVGPASDSYRDFLQVWEDIFLNPCSLCLKDAYCRLFHTRA